MPTMRQAMDEWLGRQLGLNLETSHRHADPEQAADVLHSQRPTPPHGPRVHGTGGGRRGPNTWPELITMATGEGCTLERNTGGKHPDRLILPDRTAFPLPSSPGDRMAVVAATSALRKRGLRLAR